MPRKITRRHVFEAAKWAALGLVSAQAAAVATVWSVDEMRKRRKPQSGTFPHSLPKTVTVENNTTTIFTYGQDLYEAMLDDIRHARHYIYFESFIMKGDDTGIRFRQELIAAAARGVQVWIILDTWGNLNQDPRFRRFPKMANLHTFIFPFVRTGILTGRTRDKGRDHRKILVVDGDIGYVGGYNIGTLYAHHWRDTHIRISGPATWELENSFINMWNAYRKDKNPALAARAPHHWNPRISAVENTPARGAYPIESVYLDALGRATKRAWITMAYFIPDEAMINALKAAALRGVDVQVLIPEYSNHIYADWAGRYFYEDLLRSGVRIQLFKEAMVHAKTMTVDGTWSTVGTANIDRLSFRGNFEINLEIFNENVARAMEEIFALDVTNSRELTLEEFNQRSTLARVGERLIGMLAPLL